MISINLIGRLGKDPESRMTPEGKKVTSISLAINVGWGDKKQATWFRISLWGDRWDKVLQWIKKGSQIAVTGTVSRAPMAYIKEGVASVNPIEITADQIYLISGDKKEGDNASPSSKSTPAQQEFKFDDTGCPF